MASQEEKPRLTDEEKKANHIASEQKRRQAIREGFDRLATLIPGMEGQGRSEGQVLIKGIAYIDSLLNERRQMLEKLKEMGEDVDPKLYEPLNLQEELHRLKAEKQKDSSDKGESPGADSPSAK